MRRALTVSAEDRGRAERVGVLAEQGAAAVPDLLPLLDDPSWVVRRAVVTALAAAGDPAVGPLYAILREQRDQEGRLAATVDALVASRGDADAGAIALLESMDEDPAVVCDALQILGRRRSDAAVPVIAARVGADDDNVALAAIEALGRIGGDAATTPLLATVETRNFFRTFPAIDVLGRGGSRRAVKPLLALLDERTYALEAARALGRIGDPAGIQPLIGLLGKGNDAMVRTAALALAEIHDRQAERFGNDGLVPAAFGRTGLGTSTRRVLQCLEHADASEQAALVRLLSWVGGEDAVVALVDLLGDDQTAAQAAAALASLGPACEPYLLEAIRTADSDRRVGILPLLRGTLEMTDAIGACLTDPSPAVRSLACDALARAGDTRLVPKLFELLGDSDARVGQSAIAAIQSLGSPRTEDLTLEAARSTDARIRRAGLRIAAYFGYRSSVDLLVSAMADPDERIRDAAIFGLPYLDEPRAHEALLAAAAHPSARTRATAMRAIGQATNAPRWITALRFGLHDPDAWVRYFACQTLSRLKDEGSANMIASLLSDPAGQVRVAVVEALAQLKGARALDALHAAATGEDPDVQRAAILGLGHVKDPASLPLLRQAVTGPDAATRLVALSALAGYDLPEIAYDLGLALSDGDESVRNAAVALLTSRPGPEATRALVGQLISRPIQSRAIAALAHPVEGRLKALSEALRGATAETAPLLVAALARSRSQEAIAALGDALAVQGPDARRAIVQALAAMGTASSRAILARASMDDPDEDVRQISAAALGR